MKFSRARYYLARVIGELKRNMRKYSDEDKEITKREIWSIRRAIIELKNREK